MKFTQRRSLKRTKIEIIPMIDTMFFLLVFMLSSLALVRQSGINVNLPQARTGKKQTAVDLTVTVDKARRVYVNKDEVSLDDLGTKLVQTAGGRTADLEADSVIINADLTVPHGLVVGCIDRAREVGITHFAIATAPEGAGK